MQLIRLKHLSSVRLTITLLIVIVVASIVGTIIPQTWTTEQYRARYGDTYSTILIKLQFTDVFHSYWYMILLLAFCVNLCVCSAQNFRPLVRSLRRSVPNSRRVEVSDLPFYKKIRLRSNVEDMELKMREILARGLYRLKYIDADSGIYYFERGKIGRLGPFITHASIIIILIGGIVVGITGFKEHQRINVGETVNVPHSDFQVRADEFKVELYPDGRTPKEYTSRLTIIENGEPKLTDMIEVNHPLNYRGIKFYQSGYGQTMTNAAEVELSGNDGQLMGKFHIHKGEMFQVPDTQLKIKMVELVPDFIRDSAGHVHTRSMEPRNPAALLELYEGDELKERVWSFLRFPDFHGSGKSGYSLKFLSISTADYTILQISSDPGLSIVWLGCLLMVIGMFFSFYLSYKRIWIRISPDKEKDVMEVGGRSYKDRTGFEKEFARLKAFFSKASDGD